MTAAFSLRQDPVQFKLKLADPGPEPIQLTEKYRPRKLEDIIGQFDAVQAVRDFVEAPYSGAFLFHGPTGTGKTTLALIMAAELGACEYGGLEVVESGTADKATIEKALKNLWHTSILGKGGYNVLIVEEGDMMTAAAMQQWLSAIEGNNLPPRSVVIITTNNPEKFAARFRDRCEQIKFDGTPGDHVQDVQACIDHVWMGETGSIQDAPRACDLDVVEDGAISYRRVVQCLKPLLAKRARGTYVPKPQAPIPHAAQRRMPLTTPAPLQAPAPIRQPEPIVTRSVPTKEVVMPLFATSEPTWGPEARRLFLSGKYPRSISHAVNASECHVISYLESVGAM